MKDYRLIPSPTDLRTFLPVLINTVDPYYQANPTAHGAEQWKSWLNGGLLQAIQKNTLCKLITSNDPVKQAPPYEVMGKIITQLCDSCPIILDYFKFNCRTIKGRTSAGNKQIWYVTHMNSFNPINDDIQSVTSSLQTPSTMSKNDGKMEIFTQFTPEKLPTGIQDQQNSAGKDSSWETVSSAHSARRPPNKVAISSNVPHETNRFSLLSQHPQDDEQEDDDGLSYATDQSSSPQRKSYAQVTSSSSKSSKSIAKHSIKHTHQPTLIQEMLTDEEYAKIVQAIQDDELHLMSTDILAKWIATESNRVTTAMNNMEAKMTYFEDNLPATEDDLLKNVLTKIQTEIEPTFKNSISVMEDKIASFPTQINEYGAKLDTIIHQRKDTFNKLKNDYKDLTKIYNTKFNKIVEDLKSQETASVQVINSTGNLEVKRIKDQLLELEKMQKSIDQQMKLISTTNEDLANAIQQFGQQKLDASDGFDLELYEQVENSQNEFRDWLEAYTGVIHDESLLEQLRKERMELKEETMLCQTERNLLRKDIEEWQKMKREMESNQNQFCQPTSTTAPSPPPTSVPSPPPTSNPSSPSPHPTPMPSQHPNGIEPWPAGSIVRYQQALVYPAITGLIVDKIGFPKFQQGGYLYAIITSNNVELSNVPEAFLTLIEKGTTPPTPPSNKRTLFPEAMKNATAGTLFTSPTATEHENTPSTNHGHHQHQDPQHRHRYYRPLTKNEFIYPLDSTPVSVLYDRLMKMGDKYSDELVIEANTPEHLRSFYENLKGQLSNANIYLKNYTDIVSNDHIAAINETNCVNHETALREMSEHLFSFLSQNADKFFANHPKLSIHMEAFRPKRDGLGFVKYIMTEHHPRLKENVVKDKLEDLTMPKFTDYFSHMSFLNALIVFFKHSSLNNRPYTPKEQLEYYYLQLDDRFKTAKEKLTRRLNDIYEDPTNPKSFPDQLRLESSFGLYIEELLTPEEREVDLTNPKNKGREGQINKLNDTTKTKSHHKPSQFHKTIEWKKLDGKQCSACLQFHHDVYETGCPEFAIFCNCLEFYEKHKHNNDYKKVLASYKSFKSKQLQERNKTKQYTRGAIKKMSERYENNDLQEIRSGLYDVYKSEHPDDTFATIDNFDQDETIDSWLNNLPQQLE